MQVAEIKKDININNRSASIDLFRTLAMLMVVVLHVMGHGGIIYNTKSNASFYSGAFLYSICLIAINSFGLTTGFLNADKKIKVKNILSLYLQVLFYSVAIELCFIVFKREQINLGNLLKCFLPISSCKYWYFSAYFLLFLCMPFLNLILKNSNKKFLLIVFFGAILFFGIYCFLGAYKFGDTFKLYYGYASIWLIVLYLIGGIIKKLDLASKFKSRIWILFYFVCVILSFGIFYVMQKLKGNGIGFVSSYIFLFNILNPILLLLFFASVKIKPNKIISVIAKASFGVYLIHDNETIRLTWIKDKFVFLNNYPAIVLSSLGISIAIYVACTIIELVRQGLFHFLRINVLIGKIDKCIVGIYDKIKIKDNCEINEQL